MADEPKIEKGMGWIPSRPDFRDIIFAAPRQVLEALPPAVDLSEPTIGPPWSPVWNQASLGSCGPHTSCLDTVFAMLRQQGLATGPMPSRLFVYYCTRFIMGTVNSDSGVTNRDMLKALARFGWCDETLWPYTITKFREQPPQACYDQAEKRKIDQYLAVTQNLEQMKGCIAGGDPFIFGFSVYDSIDEADNTGIIPVPARNERQRGGHDVLICGYNSESETTLGIPPRHFKLRNSWGPRWGVNGYGFISYEYASNPQLASDFWTVKHSAYAPIDPPPPSVPVILSFTATPSTIQPGGQSMLKWETSRATSATINGNTVAVNGSNPATPVTSKDYVLTATNAAGSATRTVRVEVAGTPPPDVVTVRRPQQVQIIWD